MIYSLVIIFMLCHDILKCIYARVLFLKQVLFLLDNTKVIQKVQGDRIEIYFDTKNFKSMCSFFQNMYFFMKFLKTPLISINLISFVPR